MPTVVAVRAGAPYAVKVMDDLGNQWLADEPAENGGGNAGPSPSRLLLSSLGACTVITLQMYATRKKWSLSGIEVELRLDPSGKAADGTTELTRHIKLHGDLNDEQRERLLHVANACPMHKVLTGRIRIDTALATATDIHHQESQR